MYLAMKKISLLCAVVLAGLSLTACGNSSQKKNTTSKQTSSKVVKKHHKKVKRSKKKVNKSKHSNSSSAVSASNQQNQQQQTQASNGQQQASQGVNNANDAVARARSKYGDNGGSVHWGYMIDASTGQPIRNADGSYFVKGTANDGTMTGTQYSVNVYPDGSTTTN